MIDEELESIYGPLARHAEYQRGQIGIYRAQGRRKIGEVTWISAPTPEDPTEYWIDGLICIYQNDIEGIDEQSDTEVLVHCPYCHTTHSPEAVEWCKDKHRSKVGECMPTEQERLTSLERGMSDLNHNITILQGVIGAQGGDIRVVKEQLNRIGIRLEGMDQHLERLHRQVQEQFAAINQRFDVSVTAMNQRLETIITLWTGGNQPKPPEP